MTTAGKTGTTSKNVDVWFEGMTPYYTAGIWVGYDNSGYNHSLNSAEINFHKQLWGTVMTRVHEGLENKDFEKPSGIVQCVICTKSGKLAVGGLCDADGRSGIVRNEYFVEGKQPKEVCDHHVAVPGAAGKGSAAGYAVGRGRSGDAGYRLRNQYESAVSDLYAAYGRRLCSK